MWMTVVIMVVEAGVVEVLKEVTKEMEKMEKFEEKEV